MRNKRLSIRAVALALIAVSLLATVTFADVQQQPLREPKVPVSFISRPDYADLYVDGRFVGSTDLSLRLAAGTRTIEIKREGYETWRRELIVSADNPTRVAAVLMKAEKGQ
jgi:PEGA domain